MIITLAIIIIALITYTAWKDYLYQKHLERLELLVKSRDVDEFIRAKVVENAVIEEPEAIDETENFEDVEPEAAIKALKNQGGNSDKA